MRIPSRSVLLPLSILGASLFASSLLVEGAPSAASVQRAPDLLAVRVLDLSPETFRLTVASQGTVEPRTRSELVAEVPGKIEYIGPGVEPGAFFRKDDLLIELDAGDLELAAKQARAALERARAEAEFAAATLERQQTLFDQGITSEAVIDEALRAARMGKATQLEAEANLERARRDLERSRIYAPFDGRTVSRAIDMGRFVSVGNVLATLHAVEDAEVRLPIPDAEFAFLDLPFGKEVAPDDAPAVIMRTRFVGREHSWEGRIVRIEAQIDPQTRMVNAIARVPGAYPNDVDPDRLPLAAGLFVEAEIAGRTAEDLIRVPRAALADEDTLWVVDADDRLRRREVDIFRIERDSVLISAGLVESDAVSLLEPRLAREGLLVEPVREGALARTDEENESES